MKDKCIYISVRNKRCDNFESVNGSSFCNQHSNKIFNLKLKPSAIKGAGIGLFAGKEGLRKEI